MTETDHIANDSLFSATDRQAIQAYASALRDSLAPALAEFCGSPPTIVIGAPDLVPIPTLKEQFEVEHLILQAGFSEGLQGNLALCVPLPSAVVLLDAIGVGGTEIDETQQQVLAETLGLALDQAHGRLGKMWGRTIQSAPLRPSMAPLAEDALSGDLATEPETVLIAYDVSGIGESPANFLLLFSTSMLDSMGQIGPEAMTQDIPVSSVARPAEFENFSSSVSSEEPRNLNLLMDVPLEVRVELGRAHMKIQEVLELGNGSVVELDRLAGEPVDLMVNGKLFAKGEVVVIDENFGIRVTDISNVAERLEALR